MKKTLPKKVFIVSGEPSGDQHAASLVRQLKASQPNIQFSGMGGPAMQAAGVDIVVSSEGLAVVGVVEILASFKCIFKAFYALKKAFLKEKPNLVILIDYPGFNLRFARVAKKAGCKVMHYIPPKLWVWGKGRAKTIRKYIDQVCVIFPFEADFYRNLGINAEFVGHPLADKVKPALSLPEREERFQINKKQFPVIGLLPGSRSSEIKALLSPILLPLADLIQKAHPEAQFVLPLAPQLNKKIVLEALAGHPQLNIRMTEDHRYEALSLCDLIVAASGTVTLECGLLSIPTLLLYQFHPVTYWIIKRASSLRKLGICNLIAEEEVMKEFVQENATVEAIFLEAQKLLSNSDYYQKSRIKLGSVHELLNDPGRKKELKDCVEGLLG